MVTNARSSCGWYGTLAEFLMTDKQTWLEKLKEHQESQLEEEVSSSQITAWKNCHDVLTKQISIITKRSPQANSWAILFEYELPRERGRRPDVILLANKNILVLEFKGFQNALQSHIDQVGAYVRDLQSYHQECHNRLVNPILVLTLARDLNMTINGVEVISPELIVDTMIKFTQLNQALPKEQIDLNTWLQSDYSPLPTLVDAARSIFHNEPLPQIRQAQSAGIPETISRLITIARKAKQRGERHLALVTGVPGAGKTLVGLQFVYSHDFQDVGGQRTAVFLSGNGPLVKVLQYVLKNKIFVQDIHGFLMQYGGNKQHLPEEHIWVYDEAQRAWDSARVMEKRGHALSEPQDFLRMGEKMEDWALMVGLIGEGQEIHLGEEAGLIQWNDALKDSKLPWIVHCPPKIAHTFDAASQLITYDELDLTLSLRSHLAESVQDWVSHLLNGEIEAACKNVTIIQQQGFHIYVVRDLSKAISYAKERYVDEGDKRYGLLASSKAKNLLKYGIRNEYQYTKNFREGPWFSDPTSSPQSCCQLKEVATEFSCQGLELDLPIVSWGDDLVWNNNSWHSKTASRSHAKNPHQLRLNSYRVLLSRGRDGIIMFVPNEKAMDSTYMTLIKSGSEEL